MLPRAPSKPGLSLVPPQTNKQQQKKCMTPLKGPKTNVPKEQLLALYHALSLPFTSLSSLDNTPFLSHASSLFLAVYIHGEAV